MIQTLVTLLCIYAPGVPLGPTCPMPPISAWPGLPEVFLPVVWHGAVPGEPFLCIPGEPDILCFPEHRATPGQ